jgi:hypothetical protein
MSRQALNALVVIAASSMLTGAFIVAVSRNAEQKTKAEPTAADSPSKSDGGSTRTVDLVYSGRGLAALRSSLRAVPADAGLARAFSADDTTCETVILRSHLVKAGASSADGLRLVSLEVLATRQGDPRPRPVRTLARADADFAAVWDSVQVEVVRAAVETERKPDAGNAPAKE